MKPTTPLLLAIATLIGCSPQSSTNTANVEASVPYSVDLEPLVGEWAKDGELALVVDRRGERIFIDSQVNKGWRLEHIGATAQESSITYTQKSFRTDGTKGPLDGVPFNVSISVVSGDDDSLTYTFSQPHDPVVHSDTFTRVQADG